MPFVAQTPRLLTENNVKMIRLNVNGVYGLVRNNIVVYVGKGDIRERLLAHLRGDNPLITRFAPTHWVDEIVVGDPSFREKQLILEYRPACNQKVG